MNTNITGLVAVKRDSANKSYHFLQGNLTDNYTIVEPEYTYIETKNQFVEWYVNGENASFWVNYSYCLRIWVQDNITVVFDASQKTSAIDYSEETAFDVLTEYKQGEGDVKVGSQFHMGSVYFDIPTYGRSILEFSDAENVSSGPITSVILVFILISLGNFITIEYLLHSQIQLILH